MSRPTSTGSRPGPASTGAISRRCGATSSPTWPARLVAWEGSGAAWPDRAIQTRDASVGRLRARRRDVLARGGVGAPHLVDEGPHGARGGVLAPAHEHDPARERWLHPAPLDPAF